MAQAGVLGQGATTFIFLGLAWHGMGWYGMGHLDGRHRWRFDWEVESLLGIGIPHFKRMDG
jgi:hypothetical protein